MVVQVAVVVLAMCQVRQAALEIRQAFLHHKAITAELVLLVAETQTSNLAVVVAQVQ
jgi:hypothetical protein